ncbi:transporter substrate-binding domain-containing protein [Aquabacterium humicola]|jgi:polar amino acid transport system substrate-binding protein|uniref:transporter substrate-binding domain-containing protein n=1 Tax=Aquabacterium humicola TaxID=3237377 RepID=UPI002542BB2F|nr:transporter substrate-binding domain-containing protein [Rubrivivax pictus]
MIRRSTVLKGSLVLATIVAMGSAQADLLDDVKAAKKIRIAIDLGVPPYGMTDGQMNPTGSDVETARLLARDLGVELEIVQTTGANRIPFLQTGKADLVISSLSVTPEREKVIDFSVPYAQIQSVVAGPKTVALKGFDDLAGKRMATTRGTTNDKLATEGAKGAQIVRFDDDATLITAVASGQVEIAATSPALIKAIRDSAPQRDIEVKFVMKSFPLGIGLRKGEARLQRWVNDWIQANTANGQLAAIHRRFHG